MGNSFTKVNGSNIKLINQDTLFETIEKRIKGHRVKIEDLFLVCAAPGGLEGEQKVETPFGMLQVFFIKGTDKMKSSWLLHRSKYKYPKISKVSV